MRVQGNQSAHRSSAWLDRHLQSLFRWFMGLPADEAVAFQSDLLRTVMLRPWALLLSGFGLLLMSGTAVVMTGSGWAIAWLLFDAALLAVRAVETFRLERRGLAMPESLSRLIVMIAFFVFLAFGFGCAASFATGIQPLQIVATASLMGLIAGLATRWAALPRLAIPSIMLFSAPMVLTMLSMGQPGAIQFTIIAAATTALTLQNRRNLIAMTRAEWRARGLAATDPLTGLPNRAGLAAEIDRLKDRAGGDGEARVTAMFVDLDHFKMVNDRFGHVCGDRVLREVAARLRTAAEPHFVCRLGGDEFVVVQDGGGIEQAHAAAGTIVRDVERPIVGLVDHPIVVGASIGVALAPVMTCTVETLLHQADEELYQAKRDGRGRYSIAARR